MEARLETEHVKPFAAALEAQYYVDEPMDHRLAQVSA
jgi:hypothetical protein